MNEPLLFILLMLFGLAPFSILIYWLKYKQTIVFKTSFAILLVTVFVAIASFILGRYGLKYFLPYLAIGYTSLFIGNYILKLLVQTPLRESIFALNKLSKGDLDIVIDKSDKKDETGQMNEALNKMIIDLKETAKFAHQVGEGNLDYEIQLLSDSDHLRKSLIEMQNKLKEAAKLQEEKRQEEEKRIWTNEGLAKLNEILRKQLGEKELAYEILSFIIHYLDANQGGIFIKNENENTITFDLKAFHAFNRRKYLKKSFELGESLIGSCALEKQKIHLTEIPQDYIEITSGLGGSSPKSLILIPMKMEDEVLGIIEIASFNYLEKHQIDFLENASLSIASTLNMASTNKRTSELLEKTQQQAEEMAAQEEEMRQNMEELQATQEESARRAEKSEEQIVDLKKYNKRLEDKLEELKKELKELKSIKN
ncbi:MAG: hypothetical protein MI739_09825 [Bacteroidales bacterium]|nr:hypothetical protein [Bacteroidales bacterium]